MSKKKNTVEGVLVIGDLSIPATVKVSVDLDLTDAGILLSGVVSDQTEPATEEDRDEDTTVPGVQENTEAPAPVETVSRVDKVGRAIDGLRAIGQYNAPREVVDKFPAGYTFQQADAARTRILNTVASNLSEGAIDQYGNLDAFKRAVNANYGGDAAVAEYIHQVLVEAVNS